MTKKKIKKIKKKKKKKVHICIYQKCHLVPDRIRDVSLLFFCGKCYAGFETFTYLL